LSSLDRDLIADSIVQIIGMGDMAQWTQQFFDRIYVEEFTELPKGEYNHLDINSDQLQGFGESQNAAPWAAEDALVYQASYRVGIAGGFYSLPPEISDALGYVDDVIQYPYHGVTLGGQEAIPTGAEDSGVWGPPTLTELALLDEDPE
jgi:hypothetical protein